MENFQQLAASYVNLEIRVEKLEFWVGNMYDVVAVTVVLFIFLLGVVGYFIKKKADSEIKIDVQNHVKDFIKEASAEAEKVYSKLDARINRLEEDLTKKILSESNVSQLSLSLQEAELYRLHGMINDERNRPKVSILWWVRATEKYNEVGEVKLTMISINSSIKAAKKITSALDFDDETEIHSRLAQITSHTFTDNIQLIKDELKRIKSTDKR
jgi:hypothetical protein